MPNDNQSNLSMANYLGAGVDYYNPADTSLTSRFPNPFLDIASAYMPRDIVLVFQWAEYIYLTFGTYRSASRKVVRYFLTEVTLEGPSDDERQDYLKFLNEELHIINQLAQIGDDFMCFHGDTNVVTRDGIFRIRDLAGKTVDVLSKDGVYRPAAFKSYGRQCLMEVEFSDRRKILATPEHRWEVINCSGRAVVLPTSKLCTGHRIVRTVAPRPPKGEAYREGVRHGFVFGDGSIYNKTRKTPMGVANFFGSKDAAVRPYFDDIGNQPRTYVSESAYGPQIVTKIGGLQAAYKQLPPVTASAEYWYGFVCGFLAADGSVDVYGCPLLTQVNKAHLEAIIEQLPRIGMVAGPMREYTSSGTFKRLDGTTYTCTGNYCVVSLLKRFMREEDLIIASHIDKFKANLSTTNYGKYIRVAAVRYTNITDEVFCCVEPETHTFVVGNGVLTSNCYGNVFVSIYFPFDRYLKCQNKDCASIFHIDTVTYKFTLKDLRFVGTCPKCGRTDAFERKDIRSPDRKRVRLIRWDPKRIRLRVHDISGDIQYYLEIDPRFVNKLADGNRFYLNQTPWPIIKACAQFTRGEAPLFQFDRDSIYHMRDASLSGLIMLRGWGVPPILPNFKLAYYIQILRRYDEAIAFDFIMPFRVLYPDLQTGPPGNMDTLQLMSMAAFSAQMQGMVNNKRRNLIDIQVAPFKIGYQMIGGEGTQLTPKDNIAQAMDELLNAIGYPAELYKGSLNIQAFPVALRLFEKTWGTLVDGYNDLLSWMLQRLSRYFMWTDVTGKLRSVTLADDIERKALALQAAAGQDISKTTAYRPLGIDYMEEQQRVVEEQQEIQKLQQEAMEQQQAQAQGGMGQPQQPGQPPQPGGDAGATPGDVYEQAKAMAQQLLTQVPENMRRGELIKIKHSNPTLHALVLQEMDTMRQDMARQGQAMMMQQQQMPQQKTGAAMDLARNLPSAVYISLLVSHGICEYSRNDLRKIACDIGKGSTAAKDAFHFIYPKIKGYK